MSVSPTSHPGSWLSSMMQPQTAQGTPPAGVVPQPYPGSTGYYMPHLYQPHANPGYDYNMMSAAYQYQQLPGMYGTPTGYGTATSTLSSLATSPGVAAESVLLSNDSDNVSVNTSADNASQQSEITGVLYKTTGGRVRKKPLETGKPPYSYISLICMAISDAPDKKATLREICEFITNRFPYYQQKTGNWHGNIRHNLTLNDCFVKMPRRAGDKGHPWAIDPSFEDMFDNGSLLRRKYRYKPGSTKWTKSQARSGQTTPKKRGRKPKGEAPKNVVVVSQPDGTSKLIPGIHHVQSSYSVEAPSHAPNAHHVPEGTLDIKPMNSSHSYSSLQFDLSSPRGNLIKAEQSSHNSAGSSFNQLTSPASHHSSMTSKLSGVQTSSMQSPTQTPQFYSCEASTVHSPPQQQHTSPLSHLSSPYSANQSPARLHQSPELHTPPSGGAHSMMPAQPYYNYRGFAACYPMASSTPNPACSYAVPLGGSYLSSPCTSGSLYQGLQSDYYSLLSTSPASQ